MFQVGQTIFGGRLVIVSISDDRRVIQVRSQELGDPTGPFLLTFDSNQTEADIARLLGL